MAWARIYQGNAEVRFKLQNLFRASVVPFNWEDGDQGEADLWDLVNRIKDLPTVDEIEIDLPHNEDPARMITSKDFPFFQRMGFDECLEWRRTDRGHRSLETELRAVEERLCRDGLIDPGFDTDEWEGL